MAKTRIQGTDKLIHQLREFSKEGAKQASRAVEDAADNISAIAIKNAPKNDGKLHQNIRPGKVNDLTWEILANVPYAGFVEFGTGPKVYVPAEMQSVANEWKNAGTGNLEDFLLAIEIWCKRKGIKPNMLDPDQYDYEQMYFLMAMSILHEGLRPRPFMYPAWVQGKALFQKDLKTRIETLAKRFNAQK